MEKNKDPETLLNDRKRFDYVRSAHVNGDNSRMGFALGRDDIAALVDQGLDNCMESSKPQA